MIDEATLRNIERLIANRNALPKREALQLVAAYRELATDYYLQHETILPDVGLNLPTVDKPLTVFQALANEDTIARMVDALPEPKKNRRKKNEALDE